MNIVIVAGCPGSGWENALPLLREGGLRPAGEAFARWLDAAGPSPSPEQREKLAALLAGDEAAPLLFADNRNLRLLGFWEAQYPEAKFLLFYRRAEAALAHALTEGQEPQAFLDAWQAAVGRLTQFQRRHRQRSLLLDGEAALASPAALSEACGRIGLALKQASAPHAEALPVLERWLAARIVEEQPALQASQDELEALAQPLGEAPPSGMPGLAELTGAYRQRLERERQQQRQLDEAAAKLLESGQALQAARRDAAQESELLLLQLHQVQEEFEALSLEKKQGEQALQDQLKQKADQLSQAKAEAEKQSAERAQRIDQLGQAKAALEQEKSVLATRRDELQAELDEARKARQALEAQQRDIAQENELLLLQLHQVQEELEHYFMKSQDTDMQTRQTDDSLRYRHPEFCTAGKVTVLGGNPQAPQRSLNCLIESLRHGDRSWGKVNVKLLDADGRLGLEFRKGGKDIDQPLMRWTDSGKDKAGAFMLLRPEDEKSAPLFARMPASDWQLVNGLVELLAHHLSTGRIERADKAEGLAIGPWCGIARALQSRLRQLPAAFRHDGVRLREAHVSPGHEHLWLEFANAQFAERTHPAFDFKLAAKEVKGAQFTRRANLIFRAQQSGMAPLEAWPPAQADKYGPILQLEFGSLDEAQRAEWNALTGDDRAFVAALQSRLPEALDQFEAEGSRLKRPWAQWRELLALMQPPAAVETPPAAAAPPAAEAPAAAKAAPAALQAQGLAFGEIILGEVNRRPDYEHLRIDFKNLRWNAETFPEYSFKLAAMGVQNGRFTGKMALAFRSLPQERAPLECWPQAAKDGQGPVLRLAFGGTLTEAEQADWARLTEDDRALVEALLRALPDMLQRLQKKKNAKTIKRDWADWQQLAKRHAGEAVAA